MFVRVFIKYVEYDGFPYTYQKSYSLNYIISCVLDAVYGTLPWIDVNIAGWKRNQTDWLKSSFTESLENLHFFDFHSKHLRASQKFHKISENIVIHAPKTGRICRDWVVETISQFRHLASIFPCHFLSRRYSSGRMHGSNIFQHTWSSNCEFAPRGQQKKCAVYVECFFLFSFKIPFNWNKFGVYIDYIASLEAAVTFGLSMLFILSGRVISPLY